MRLTCIKTTCFSMCLALAALGFTTIGFAITSVATAAENGYGNPPVAMAGSQAQDHIIVLAKASTIAEVVEQELASTEFVEQIARYNRIDDLESIITNGSTIRIPKPYLNEQQAGIITFSKGDVTLIKEHRVVNPTSTGTRVAAGNQIKTGADGFVSLSFRSGTVVNIQPHSHMIVVNIDCINESTECVIALRAEKGVMNSRVQPRTGGKPPIQYSVETPFLSAAVRGTAFYVDVRDQAGRLGVTEGLVAAEANRTASTLPRGKGLLARTGHTPEKVDLLPPPVLAITEGDWISAEDTIHWRMLDDAVSYQMTIGEDGTLDEPVKVEQLTGTSTEPPLIRPGKYYIALAGVDQQGFVGLPEETTSFNFAEIDENEPPLILDIVRRGPSVSISITNYDAGAVEISYGEEFDSLTERKVTYPDKGIVLEIAPSKPLVVRARKLLGEHLVSRYSDLYTFEGVQ